MRTFGYKTSNTPVEFFDEIHTINSKQEFYQNCDYVVSVLPNTSETK